MHTRTILAATAATGATVAVVGLVPQLTGSSWSAVVDLVAGVDPGRAGLLAVLWIAGLVAYCPVLVGSLPGLAHRRALALNLAGSAVANAVPGGGPLSTVLTSTMARSWGFASSRVAGFLVVSTVWTAAGRVAVGLVGVLAWLLAGQASGAAGGAAVFVPAAVLGALLVLVAGSPRRTAATAGALGRAAGRLAGRPGLGERAADGAVRVRALALDTSRRSWPRIVLGLVAYPVLLVVLLDGCLRAIGHPAPLAVVVAAVGAERVAAAVPVTPGGAGVADLSVAAVLAAGGLGPAAAAGALLYRLFTFGLEIPVGALVALGWAAGRRDRREVGAVPA